MMRPLEETKEHPIVNDDCQKWRLADYENETARKMKAKHRNARSIAEAKVYGEREGFRSV